MKVLGIYLPQYHEVKENNEWWGQGYTEWNAVKNARPLFRGHNQPRTPLNHNYYDLVKNGVETWKWQSELAKKYGVYGFCIYHYWFEGKQMLEKPMEILRDHPELDIHYCICWANESWHRNWYGASKELLIEQTYGNKDAWRNHFEYLNTFFQDKRYIKIDNKPVLNVYRSSDILDMQDMLEVWNRMAKDAGFSGIYLVSAMTAGELDQRDELFDAYYDFEPGYTLKKDMPHYEYFNYLVKYIFVKLFNKVSRRKLLEHKIRIETMYRRIEKRKLPEKVFPGTFPGWDNTPRRGIQGLCYNGASPELFEGHLSRLHEKYEGTEFIYINAWNEWGEGAYLEPDEENGFAYLQAVRNVFTI